MHNFTISWSDRCMMHRYIIYFNVSGLWKAFPRTTICIISSISASQTVSDSQQSQFSVCNQDRLNMFNQILLSFNKSPVKQIETSLTTCSERTQRRYTSKVKYCVRVLCKTFCPGEGNVLHDMFISPKGRICSPVQRILLFCLLIFTSQQRPGLLKGRFSPYLLRTTILMLSARYMYIFFKHKI